jgi:hypothetical protein
MANFVIKATPDTHNDQVEKVVIVSLNGTFRTKQPLDPNDPQLKNHPLYAELAAYVAANPAS